MNNIIKKLNQLYIKLFIANACDIILLLIKIQQHVLKCTCNKQEEIKLITLKNGDGIKWPHGKRIAVLLTFDFDAEYLRYP